MSKKIAFHKRLSELQKISQQDMADVMSLVLHKEKTDIKKDWLGKLDILQLSSHWSQIVGTPLDIHTKPDKIQKDTLYVKVDHPVFAQQIQINQKYILQNIYKLFHIQFTEIRTA